MYDCEILETRRPRRDAPLRDHSRLAHAIHELSRDARHARQRTWHAAAAMRVLVNSGWAATAWKPSSPHSKRPTGLEPALCSRRPDSARRSPRARSRPRRPSTRAVLIRRRERSRLLPGGPPATFGRTGARWARTTEASAGRTPCRPGAAVAGTRSSPRRTARPSRRSRNDRPGSGCGPQGGAAPRGSRARASSSRRRSVAPHSGSVLPGT